MRASTSVPTGGYASCRRGRQSRSAFTRPMTRPTNRHPDAATAPVRAIPAGRTGGLDIPGRRGASAMSVNDARPADRTWR
jgi:hypothetical protein